MTEMITRILVPVDFSASSDRSVAYAIQLADRFGAAVELLHVIEDPNRATAWASEAFVPPLPDVLHELTATTRRRLSEMQQTVADKGVTATTVITQGAPAAGILDHLANNRFDLVVMGTHGRTGLSHVLLGSVAEHVVRKSPCPVLTVRRPPEDGRGQVAPTAAVA